MSIVVTGATGQLGRLVVESLLTRGVPAEQIVATGRDLARLDDLAARGVVVRRADFDDRASLDAAFAGADRVLLVSGPAVGSRVPQHLNVIDAAKAAGVALLAYTSITNADRGGFLIAAEHKATEEAIVASGLPHTFLRNGWYLENYTGQLPVYLEHGVIGSAGDGRVSPATRADLAEATAAALLLDRPASIYELGGEAFSLKELAATVGDLAGKDVVYTDLPAEDFAKALVGAGLPDAFAGVLAEADVALSRGELYADPADLAGLLGRPATTLAEALRAAL
ncbi:SDR family oxidoreductase [Nocardioides ginsengisoli]|uniref:SDR family oxidoreductase n=1 Tax=Nocardioides ginsengisoli TaxID=363868 RepID=A0ABW3W4C1_9ACTN